jgi:putative copper export protein
VNLIPIGHASIITALVDPSAARLADSLTAVRLSIHVLAAAIFVGGQLTVAGLLPTLRTLGADAPRSVARQFARLQWPAYAVLVATGFWNVGAVHSHTHAWTIVLSVKIAIVALTGVAAVIHSRATSKALIGAFGGVAGLGAIVSLILGILLAG